MQNATRSRFFVGNNAACRCICTACWPSLQCCWPCTISEPTSHSVSLWQGDDTWMQRLEREQVAGAKGAAGMERRQAQDQFSLQHCKAAAVGQLARDSWVLR